MTKLKKKGWLSTLFLIPVTSACILKGSQTHVHSFSQSHNEIVTNPIHYFSTERRDSSDDIFIY